MIRISTTRARQQVSRWADRIETELRHRQAEEAEQEVALIVERARQQWGVDTGEGRRSLRVRSESTRGGWVVRVTSDDPTLPWQSPTGAPPTYWELLIVRPLQQASRRIGRVLAGKLGRSDGR